MTVYFVTQPIVHVGAPAKVEFLDFYPYEISREALDRMSPLRRKQAKPPAKKIRLKTRKTLDHWCHAAGDMVSEEVAKILRQFDLGPVRLNPVEVVNKSGDVLPRPWYSFGNRIDRDSPQTALPRIAEWELPAEAMEDGRFFTLSRVANENDAMPVSIPADAPDLWFDRRNLQRFFLSERLLDALRAKELCGNLPFFRCRIVDGVPPPSSARPTDAPKPGASVDSRTDTSGPLGRLLQFVTFRKTSGKS